MGEMRRSGGVLCAFMHSFLKDVSSHPRRLLELEGSLIDLQDQAAHQQAALEAAASGSAAEVGAGSTVSAAVVLPHMACSAPSGGVGAGQSEAQLAAKIFRLQTELTNALSSKQVGAHRSYGSYFIVKPTCVPLPDLLCSLDCPILDRSCFRCISGPGG